MNCEKGNLTVVTSGHLKGRIQIVLECYPSPYNGQPCWAVDPPHPDYYGFADAALKALRNKPGEDETLQWAPVPSIGETA